MSGYLLMARMVAGSARLAQVARLARVGRAVRAACATASAALAAALGPTLPCTAATLIDGPPADPRLRELHYSPHAVITLPVKRGVVALVMLDDDEAIAELAAGLGGDCAKPESAWCITAQPGGRHFFIKAKSNAQAANNVVVVTDRRQHTFRFVVLPDDDARQPVYKVVVKAPAPRPAASAAASATASVAALPAPAAANPSAVPAAAAASPANLQQQLLPLILGLAAAPMATPGPAAMQRVADRLLHKPQVLNTQYMLAEGAGAQDIVPTLVFDDGRFTYFRFASRSELPTVFHVLPDGTETLVNARMEDELLVVDRVSRRLMLRAGSAAVGIWNEAFDIEGEASTPAPGANTTVPGVDRVLRAADTARRVLPAAPGGTP